MSRENTQSAADGGESSSPGMPRSLNHASSSSIASFSSSSSNGKPPPTTASSVTSTSLASTLCSACGKAMSGPFVRALGTVFHLNCFKCMDCGDVVASKFFPIDGPDGRQMPLCERDYFRRLSLICAKCGMALRGSYITACNKKFHVEHFTCSLCPTLFGPQDSYYEHEGDVYCHFHYSTRFATKCVGCNSAILKQFVEINRNSRDECWHPECYMIHKFWNVKVVSRRPASVTGPAPYEEEEQRETHTSLREKQIRMEQQVYRIWTVLSAFEESSAACISDMLRQVSNGQYLDAIRMADKFILHVEVLFATIDDLEFQFARLNMKGMSHVREARMLCRKTVELFTLLSHTQETGARRMGMTQELLALVTGLAHYLKILIRIALTGALKLERDSEEKAEHERNYDNSDARIHDHLYGDREDDYDDHAQRNTPPLASRERARDAMANFLDKLHLLAVQGGNPSARRLIRGQNGEVLTPPSTTGSNVALGNGAFPPYNAGTYGVTYGFRSLAPENAGEAPFSTGSGSKGPVVKGKNPPSDLCVKCNQTVEEDCVRLGTYQRWHAQCVQCAKCGKVAAAPAPPKPAKPPPSDDTGDAPEKLKVSTARRPPPNAGAFVYEVDSMKDTPYFGEVPAVILCTEHAHAACRGGFQSVQRLEQYAFLLNVALRRLYTLLKKQGVVPLTFDQPLNQAGVLKTDPYRNSGDIMRMKSVHLDRKLSATAHLPKRSTVVESPAGKSVRPSEMKSLPSSESQRPHDVPHPTQVHSTQPPSSAKVGGQHRQHASPSGQQQQQHTGRPQLGPLGLDGSTGYEQVLRPSFARVNTEVKIVDDSAPPTPSTVLDENPLAIAGRVAMPSDPNDGITLADIPQLVEAAQRKSLPRENAIPYIAELNAVELTLVKHAAMLALTRSPLRDQFDADEILELLQEKKGGTFWNKIFKQDKKIKKKGVFGVPLELLVEREGADSLLGATRATLRVPSFIDDVVSAMRQMDMSVEGIFRKNGNIRRLRDLTDAIDRDASSVDLSQDNPVQLAALLKKFLRDLPDPLMTFKLHKLLVASQSVPAESDRRRYLHLITLILPKSHRDTMEVLFVFLKWVASFAHMDEETGSKMDLGNLATVICPSILYSRNGGVRDDSFGAIRVVTALLEDQDLFYSVPEDFVPLLQDQDYFANAVDMPSKDLMKKIDTWMKLKNGRATPGPNNGPSYSSSPYANGPPPNASGSRYGGPQNLNSPVMDQRGPGLGTPGSTPPERPMRPPLSNWKFPNAHQDEWRSQPPSPRQHGYGGQTYGSPQAPYSQSGMPPLSSAGRPPPSSRPSSYVQPRPAPEIPRQNTESPHSDGVYNTAALR
ncbi:RhoGAP-domain-containing protein [Fistulina hepatica ATCC 64428]|uniref:RhoGAP-domain-containing protein n=1 Tax=Fistulina hepatica ATCC 64428 TaxID=1128425 RepID=A0A0D7AM42_9AGAR|nr:RhoGAP-domain-containing protein [Fistulina hepatica ATCC 64428]